MFGIDGIIKCSCSLLCAVNRHKFQVLIFVVFISAGLSSVVSGQTDSVAIYNANTGTKIKYSKILGIVPDSVCCTQMYEVIDRWAVFINKNPQKLKLQYQCVFVQFIYYLAYGTKIPADFKSLYNDAKTYRFKNPTHLRIGDLVFWGESVQNQSSVGLFVQNNLVVYPNSDGSLNFVPLDDIKSKNVLILGKIVRDE